MAEDDDLDGVEPAKRFEELPLYTRQFFTSLKKDDVKTLSSAMGLFRWANTTGRVGRVVVVTGLSLFGAMVAAAQGWDYVVVRFFTKGH